ncbi:sulfur carrier protein ThiS [Thalassotalea sediminis]|uniref:sulfur carrier protein ThiS n=1 Tax=Thalassotalea sediminis TaxID=1759089 RepID=UPI002572C561|nr:sulfur carrier protein ThiS [Thalassotalea sediminis]
MNIYINGQAVTLTNQSTITDALQYYLSETQKKHSFAVALNCDFVAKSDYAQTYLTHNDALDVLFPIQGG